MTKRWRKLKAKPRQQRVGWGCVAGDSPDLLFAWGGNGACKSDSRMISNALSEEFITELEARGYDITTLKFSVELKEEA